MRARVPFTEGTAIRFDLPVGEHVNLMIYTVEGELVTTLADEPWPAGSHVVSWNGRDSGGQLVPSGTYFARFSAGEYKANYRIVVSR